MKIKLLPLAVAAAIAAPGVALADGPNLYGRLNVSYEMVDVDNGVDSADNWQLLSNNSRIGVKGDAAINDNLSVIYQIEFGLTADGDGTVWNNRDRFVGLQGNFGTIQAGKFDTPLKKAQGKVDLFNDLAGDIQYLFVGENRPNNILQYSSPEFSGVQLNFAFMPGEEFDTDRDGPADSFSASVVFNQNNIYAALAYDSEVESTAYFGVDAGYNLITGTAFMDTLRLVGVITLDALQLGAMYQMAETSDADVDGDVEQDGFLLSASYKLDKLVFKGQLGMTTITDNDLNEEIDAEQLSLGVDYLLSKQTTAFVYYNMLSYEGDWAGADEETKDNFGIGIVHNF